MSIVSRIVAYFRPVNVNVTVAGPGRKTQPNEFGLMSGYYGRDYQEFHGKDLTEIQSWDHRNIIKVLRSISPETSLATTIFLRMFDSEMNIQVKKPNGDDHIQGKNALIALLGVFSTPDPGRFSMPNSLRDLALKAALDCLYKGALCSELLVNEDLMPTSLVYVDPWTIDFFWNAEQNRWVPRQQQTSGWQEIDVPTFSYVPVDPLGNAPYGNEQITSAIRSIIFKVMVMQDLRRAIHTNGWPRLDFAVLEEAILKHAPGNVKTDPKKLAEFFEAQLRSINDMYNNLNPDDNIFHTDSLKVQYLQANNGRTFDAKPLLDAIDNQISNGLKTFSVLLSKKFGGGSEGFTSSEMILYTKMIAGFQKIVEVMFERQLTLALRYLGIMATVDVSFTRPELRTDMEMAQWMSVAIKNTSTLYDEQAIGEVEKRQRLRELGGFTGPVPTDLAPERRAAQDPNQPDRPTIEEDDKEGKRQDTNRQRRSGRTL